MNNSKPVTVEIYGDNRFDTYTKTRTGCRGIVIRDGLVLVSHELVSGWYLIPGGGLETGETPEECCVREVREETGFTVVPRKHFLTLNEYYEEYRFVSHYFICECLASGAQQLTPEEKKRGLVAEWMGFDTLYGIYARHEDYRNTSEEKRGSYQREYTALTEYLRLSDNDGRQIRKLYNQGHNGA